MIIWSGHGILIPVLVVGGFVLGMLVGGNFGGTESDRGMGVSMIVAGMAVPSLVWLYALTLGKTVEQSYLDPKTRQMVTVARRHTLYFIPAFFWALIFTAVGLATIASGVFQLTSANPAETGPGAAEFDAANSLIAKFDGEVAFGNTPEAKQLAEEFSAAAKQLRETLIESKRSSSSSSSDKQFLAYCQMSPHGIAFLLHVPDLSRFKGTAKTTMADAAWVAATSVLERHDHRPANVAVGIRGFLFYDTFLCGAPSSDSDPDPLGGIRSRHNSTDKEVLYPYFAPDAPGAAADPEAGGGVDGPGGG